MLSAKQPQAPPAQIASPVVRDEDGGDGANLLMVHQHPSSQVTLGSMGLNISKGTQSKKYG